MEISRGFRAKVFFFFVTMGAIPIFLLIGVTAYNAASELKDFSIERSTARNKLVSEHLTELIAKNQAVLKSISMSPKLVEYLQNPTDEGYAYVSRLLYDTDIIFADKNVTALTGVNGWQIIRTDGATLVNLKKRQHFQEAMKGKSYVSDIITSMATGKMIIIIESPVINEEGKPIGMVQRNFDLNVLQEYVRELDDDKSSIIVMDRTGSIIANSDYAQGVPDGYAIENGYKFILDRIFNSNGVLRDEINGEDSFATYSRNIDTGWMIVTVYPYHFIADRVYSTAIKSVIFGVVTLFICMLLAYLLTIRVTKPIIEMTEVVGDIVSGKLPANKLEVEGDDEFKQIAVAVNKLRSERDAYQLESELDKLTELFNKKTMEDLCKMKLKTFNENEASNIFMAFYIIDLDHFKEVNDFWGHQFGDKVLVEFARGLRKIFRPNDCIGRFGGDEFVVIVDSLPNMEVVIRKAEQIKQIAFNLTVDGKDKFVTASIGIAIAPQNGRDYESLFAAADKAVYHVKNNGKNGYYCQLFEEDEN